MNRVRTDAAAHTHALRQLGHLAVGELDDTDYAIQFERRINEHGVAVRRVVMYGPEECDPNVLVAQPAQRAVVAAVV